MTALSLLVPLVLGLLPSDDSDSRPSSDLVRQARQRFQGQWTFTTINDNGEKFDANAIHQGIARDGTIIVQDRSIKIMNPETGGTRLSTYRLDPSRTPHRIDLINQDDWVFQGIYKFEGDILVICLERDPEGGRPTTFDAPSGSDRVLFYLSRKGQTGVVKKTNILVGGEDIPLLEPAQAADSKTVVPSVVSSPVTVTVRKPSEGELRIAYDMLTGNWDINSIVDDGSDLGPRLIREKFAEDGRIRIADRTATFITPKSSERHISTIRVDPTKSPNWIDLTTQLDSVLKGIYRFEGDQLILCLAKFDGAERPTEFSASTGSDRMLLRLSLPKNTPKPKPTSTVVSMPVPPPEPTPDEKARAKDEMVRGMLSGSWTYTDKKGAVTLLLRSDGTFVTTRTWAKAIKRLFEGNSTTSQGSWSYVHGTLTGRITSTTDPFLLGHIYSARLQTIGEDTLVFKDTVGQLRMARKLR